MLPWRQVDDVTFAASTSRINSNMHIQPRSPDFGDLASLALALQTADAICISRTNGADAGRLAMSSLIKLKVDTNVRL